MSLFFQREQIERDGVRQLLNGIATQFEAMTYFTALYGSKSIEEVGRELAVALRERPQRGALSRRGETP